MTQLNKTFFERDPQICARELVGCHFRWGRTEGRIVETEAYAEFGDEACHTFFRPSAREFVQKNEAGTAYVYLNYGMYWLTNVLCIDSETNQNGFVLLRALEPVNGVKTMQKRRDKTKLTDLCSGPGKLSMAMGIDGRHHESNLTSQPSRGFFKTEPTPGSEVGADRRVGISKAKERKWRFLETGNPHVSVAYGKVK